MLYINDELVSTRDKSESNVHHEIVKDYHKTLKEIKDKYGKQLVIETRIRPTPDAKTGMLRMPGPRGLLLVSNMTRRLDDDTVITEELRYSPHILKKDEKTGEYKNYSPNLIITKSSHSINVNRDPDLAYYALKCGYVGLTSAEGKKFHIYDPEEENRTKDSKRRMEGQVLSLIYTALPETKLRTLAKSFGVHDVNIKSVETVREDLYMKLQDNEGMKKLKPDSAFRGFKEFVESAEVKYHDQISALCSDAIEAGKLVFDENDRRWVIDYKDGATPFILKELAGEEYGDPLGSLVNFLITEPNSLRKIENVMGIGKVDEPPLPQVTMEMIVKEHKVPVLKKYLRQLKPGIEIKKTAKLQELKDSLYALVSQESLQETQE